MAHVSDEGKATVDQQLALPTSSEHRDVISAAIPVKFVMEDPVCADKLVRSMNITNVRILPRRGSIEASPIETIGLHCVDRECLQPI